MRDGELLSFSGVLASTRRKELMKAILGVDKKVGSILFWIYPIRMSLRLQATTIHAIMTENGIRNDFERQKK